jgi:hypothetical protein
MGGRSKLGFFLFVFDLFFQGCQIYGLEWWWDFLLYYKKEVRGQVSHFGLWDSDVTGGCFILVKTVVNVSLWVSIDRVNKKR